MLTTLTARLTCCRNGRPLVIIESAPFNGLEINPANLLALASQLVHVAKESFEHDSAHRFSDRQITLEIKNV